MNKIYIVLTFTGTILSRIIRTFTKDEFCHVSISLDLELEKLYSFGRLNPYNPFIGGFVHEAINRGTFKRFRNTKARIYCLDVTQEQYEKMEYVISQVESKKEDYTFNVLGLFAVGLHKRIAKERSFYCAEFVKYVLEQAEINTSLPVLIKPEDFKNINGLKEVYDGLLRNYTVLEAKVSEDIKLEDIELEDILLCSKEINK